jgi:hypothetical protein
MRKVPKYFIVYYLCKRYPAFFNLKLCKLIDVADENALRSIFYLDLAMEDNTKWPSCIKDKVFMYRWCCKRSDEVGSRFAQPNFLESIINKTTGRLQGHGAYTLVAVPVRAHKDLFNLSIKHISGDRAEMPECFQRVTRKFAQSRVIQECGSDLNAFIELDGIKFKLLTRFGKGNGPNKPEILNVKGQHIAKTAKMVANEGRSMNGNNFDRLPTLLNVLSKVLTNAHDINAKELSEERLRRISEGSVTAEADVEASKEEDHLPHNRRDGGFRIVIASAEAASINVGVEERAAVVAGVACIKKQEDDASTRATTEEARTSAGEHQQSTSMGRARAETADRAVVVAVGEEATIRVDKGGRVQTSSTAEHVKGASTMGGAERSRANPDVRTLAGASLEPGRSACGSDCGPSDDQLARIAARIRALTATSVLGRPACDSDFGLSDDQLARLATRIRALTGTSVRGRSACDSDFGLSDDQVARLPAADADGSRIRALTDASVTGYSVCDSDYGLSDDQVARLVAAVADGSRIRALTGTSVSGQSACDSDFGLSGDQITKLVVADADGSRIRALTAASVTGHSVCDSDFGLSDDKVAKVAARIRALTGTSIPRRSACDSDFGLSDDQVARLVVAVADRSRFRGLTVTSVAGQSTCDSDFDQLASLN